MFRKVVIRARQLTPKTMSYQVVAAIDVNRPLYQAAGKAQCEIPPEKNLNRLFKPLLVKTLSQTIWPPEFFRHFQVKQ